MKHLSILGCALAAASACAAAPLRITLKEAAVLPQGAYVLGEIAAVEGAEAARLAKTLMGSAPRAGSADVVSRTRVERLLRGQGLQGAVAWAGPATVRVQAAAVQYPTAAAQEAAQEHLQRLLAAPGSTVRVRALDMPAHLALPQGRIGFQVRASDARPAPRRHMSVWVDVSVDDVFYQSIAVPFAVEVRGPLLVARRALDQGQPLSCDNVEPREVELTAYADVLGACVPGLQLRRRLEAGEALRRADLRPVPAVAQGAVVRLVQADGAIRIEVSATALRDGELGQTIQVRIAGSSEPVAAVVTAPGVATLTRS